MITPTSYPRPHAKRGALLYIIYRADNDLNQIAVRYRQVSFFSAVIRP